MGRLVDRMARQLIFSSNIKPDALLPTIAEDNQGKTPYYQVLPFFDREIASLCRSPDGTKAVVTHSQGVVYELSSGNVFHPRTQDLKECPAYKTFAQLKRIAHVSPRELELTLTELFFDFRRASGDLFEDEQRAWAAALEEFKQGKFDRDIASYLRGLELRW